MLVTLYNLGFVFPFSVLRNNGDKVTVSPIGKLYLSFLPIVHWSPLNSLLPVLRMRRK